MTTSRIPAVIDALVATLTASLSGTAHVYDGQWTASPPSKQSFITVGWTPDESGPTGEQEWVGAGNSSRGERIDIPCYADAYSGSTQIAPRRNAAFDLLSAVETSLRADPTLGGILRAGSGQRGVAELGSYSVRQEQVENGIEVGITFHVLVETQI